MKQKKTIYPHLWGTDFWYIVFLNILHMEFQIKA